MTARPRYLTLRRQARDTGRPFTELLELYALEGFLRRLAASAHADEFVLKGGMLMAAFDTRRPTRDIKLDISTGDPIRPGPVRIDVPALLDTDEPITMRGFPITMVLAEKAVTAVERGTANTRWRDLGTSTSSPNDTRSTAGSSACPSTRSPSIEEPACGP